MVNPTGRVAVCGGVAVAEDDGMQCSNHPFRNSSPGGICAFCLQEKLGKLVSSSSSSFFSAASSSHSFRSDSPSATASSAALRLTAAAAPSTSSASDNHVSKVRRARIPFLLTQKKKKNNTTNNNPVLKRSKSTATPRFFTSDNKEDLNLSPRRRGFWSFLHMRKPDRPKLGPCPDSFPGPVQRVEYVVVEEGESSSPSSTNTASFGRKVSRSRSVGCGSRSFSGDFFERISTGFGDCTLRRVESHREGRRSTSVARTAAHSSTGDPIRERVRCGGLFGGFMITSSSSSSSSSSYWAASMAEDHGGRPNAPAATPGVGTLVHGRSRSWGWAFASPMRAVTKPSTTIATIKEGKKINNSTTSSTTPNVAAIPSLLAARG